MWQFSDEVLAWQQMPMLPPSFMIYPYNINDEDLDNWQAGIPCDACLLPAGDYDMFAAEFLMPRSSGPRYIFLFNSLLQITVQLKLWLIVFPLRLFFLLMRVRMKGLIWCCLAGV